MEHLRLTHLRHIHTRHTHTHHNTHQYRERGAPAREAAGLFCPCAYAAVSFWPELPLSFFGEQEHEKSIESLLPPSPSLVWSYNYVLPLPPPTERKKENSGCCLSAKYELVVLQHSFPVGKLAGLCTLGFVFSRGVGFSPSERERLLERECGNSLSFADFQTFLWKSRENPREIAAMWTALVPRHFAFTASFLPVS